MTNILSQAQQTGTCDFMKYFTFSQSVHCRVIMTLHCKHLPPTARPEADMTSYSVVYVHGLSTYKILPGMVVCMHCTVYNVSEFSKCEQRGQYCPEPTSC